MSEEEFYKYVTEMQNFYGQKLSDIELRVWYDSLKFMTIQRFNFILSEIYKTNKYMPRLAEILQVHNQIPYVSTQKKEIENNKCEKCDNTGYVRYYKNIDDQQYLYMAVCDCGRQEKFDGRKCLDPKNKSEYYIPTMQEINLNVKTTKPTKEQVLKSMQMIKNSNIIPETIKAIIRKEYANLT